MERRSSPTYNRAPRMPPPPVHMHPDRMARLDSRPPPPPANKQADDRAARLAAMTANASNHESERTVRLASLLEREKAEAEAEARARAKSARGMDGARGRFLDDEQKRVFDIGLGERMKRGKVGMVGID